MERLTERPTFARDAHLFVALGVTALFLLIFLHGERASLSESEEKIAGFEEKLLQAKQTIRENRHLLIPSEEKILNPALLREKSLRTVVKEATEKAGISRSLEAVNPSEDKKGGIVRARVSLGNLDLRKIVEFIVSLKNLSAGIRDTEAIMRMQGYNVDRWRLELTLEAPAPSGGAGKKE